ncbi:MAG: phage tail tube protein, partial [Thiomicrorhabdus sp.]|nr:phage tail tube protein [Thiomicrorhabdus sp.]
MATGAEVFNVVARFADEDSFGTLNASANYFSIPIISSTVAVSQNLTDTNEFDGTYVNGEPIADNISVAGDITLRVRPKSSAQFLKWLFGAPVTTGTGPTYTHTYTAGATVAKSFQMEIEFADITEIQVTTGLVITGITANLQTEGQYEFVVSVIGKQQTMAVTTTFTGAETDYTTETEVFNSKDGTLTVGTTTAKVSTANYALNRPAEAFYGIGDSGLASDVYKSKFTANGDITAQFIDSDLMDDALARTPDNISVGVSDGTNSLTFNNPTVK